MSRAKQRTTLDDPDVRSHIFGRYYWFCFVFLCPVAVSTWLALHEVAGLKDSALQLGFFAGALLFFGATYVACWRRGIGKGEALAFASFGPMFVHLRDLIQSIRVARSKQRDH